MGKIFSINVDESFFDVLVQHIFSEYKVEEIPELKIILPCKRDVLALLNAFKNYNTKRCIILPEIISLEHIDEEDLILNLDKIEVINPTKRILLLIEFILKWNKENNDNFPIDLVYSLSSLLNTIQISKTKDYSQSSEYSKKIGNFIDLLIKTWGKILKNLRVVDILVHKNDYINNMSLSLQRDQHIIFIRMGRDEIYKSFIKAVYDLPLGKIILPNLNFKIKEKDWQLLDKKHYQYCLKSLLDYLNVNRSDVSCLSGVISARDADRSQCLSPLSSQCVTLGSRKYNFSDTIVDYIFDTTADLSKANREYSNNIEVITCDSEEEEAQIISLIVKNDGHENVSLFTSNQLLTTRVACLLKQYNIENYPYITLLLYSIEVLTSNWNSVQLLSILKHKLVTFGYTQEEYSKILSEFEIEILRNFNISGLKEITSIINEHKKIKYKKDILLIINKLEVIFDPLFHVMNCSVFEVVEAHLQCVKMLSGINFSELNDEVGNFVSNFINACEGIKIKCSLELYSQILTLFLKKGFFLLANDFSKFSLYKNKVVILAGFNEGSYPPSFQSPLLNSLIREKFNLPSVQEEQGYFLYTLYNLFGASKVYITRSLNHRKPILLQRLEVLLHGSLSKQPYRDWLKILNTPEYIVPCTQPMPKPSAEVREEKMHVMSSSAVEKLIRNPYSFYVEYILNLKKLRDLNSKPSILEFGTMVHNILAKYSRRKIQDMSSQFVTMESSCKNFWIPWSHTGMTITYSSFERDLLTNIAKKEFFSSHFNFSSMWWVRLQRIIQSFFEFDKSRSQYIEVEKSFSFPIHVGVIQVADTGIYVSCDGGSQCQATRMINRDLILKEILLTAKCDRVEYLPNNQIAIIDYKLGLPPSNDEVMSGFFPQLILQALAVESVTKKEIAELAYWKFDYDQIKVISLQDYKQKIQDFQYDLVAFLSNYLSENTPFIASPYLDKFLRLNSYKHLERVVEWL